MLKPCPFCGEQIQSVAAKCRYCGEWLDPSRRPDTSGAAIAAPAAAEAPAAAPQPVVESWAPPPAAPASTLGGPIGQDSMGDTLKGLPLRQFYDPNLESGLHSSQRIAPLEQRAAADAAMLAAVAQPNLLLSPGTDPSRPVLPTDGPALPNLAGGPQPARPSTLLTGSADAPPRPPASRMEEFERAFLGGDDIPLDDPADEDPFSSRTAPAAKPPYGLIAAVMGGVALIALLLFKDSLFPPEIPPETEPVAELTAPPPAELPAPTPPETKPAAPEPVRPPAPDDPAFLEQLAKARASYTAGKLKLAATALEALAQQAPEHPEVLLLTAQVQLEEGQLPAAQTTADRCVALDPALADCWLTLGVLRQNNKDAPGAVAAYEEYLKLAPTGRYARDATSQLARLKK